MIRKVSRCLRSTFSPEGMTPLPVKVMSILFLIMLVNGMAARSCLSYLPKLVKSFGISEVNTGHYAGLLATSLYVGYILFSLLWGYVGDVMGNKFAMILSLSAMSITTLSFGYSASFYWAIVTRFLQGCSMGFVVISKSMLAQALDETNMSLGFSIFFTCWTFTFIIGPSTSGFLVFPAEKYPDIFSQDSMFARFTVLLPNLLLVILGVIITIATILYLPESRKPKADEMASEGSSITDSDLPSFAGETINDGNYEDPIAYRSVKVRESVLGKVNTCGNLLNKVFSRTPRGLRKIKELFNIRDYVVAIHAFGILGFCIIGVEEMFPVFAATSADYNGLNMNTSEIGFVLLASSVSLLVIQVFATTAMCKRYGERRTFIVYALLLVFSVPIIPVLSSIPSNAGQKAGAIVVNIVAQVSINGTVVTLNILLNNAVTKDVYGCANGIAFAMHSLGRVIAPSVFGSLYTWSLKNVKSVTDNKHPLGFPFNQFFTFYLGALAFLVCALVVSMISPKLDTR